MSPEITKIIEQYLQNELSAADRQVFEQKLAQNDQLLNEVVLQQQLHEAAKRASQRAAVKQTAKRYHFRKNVATTAVVVVAAAAIAAAAWLSFTGNPDKGQEQATTEQSKAEQALTQLVEKVEESPLPLEGLPAQYFNLSQQDTVLLSEQGILLSVPEGAFALNGKPYSGPKVVQWQEAIHAADIVKAGLSTMSGDRLLETQGMFGLQAFTPDGRELDINPKVGVYVQVPVDEKREGMQLFEGRKGKNGIIDWENPRPLEKLPVPADMADLDFYPAGYEPKLNELQWKTGKKDRDSLYLSFEEAEDITVPRVMIDSESRSAWLDPSTGMPIVLDSLPIGTNVFSAATTTGRSWQDKVRFTTSVEKTDAMHGTIVIEAQLKPGWYIFSVDHDPSKFDLIGSPTTLKSQPSSNYELNGNLKDGQKPLVSEMGDVFGKRAIFRQAFTSQTDQTYLINFSLSFQICDENGCIFPPYPSFSVTVNGSGHIPPSKVLAFWKPEFNNTILATRDFEKRMKSIHGTCSEAVLDKYTDNLNKPFYAIDEEVAAMGYPQFAEFAKERVGGVELGNPHMNNLRQFYARATGALRWQAKHDRNTVRKLEAAWDDKLNKARLQEQHRTARRNATNYSAEYDLNYRDAARQLGYTVGFVVRRRSAARAYNLDKFAAFVTNATTSRTTSSYTDPKTGRTATLVYNPFSVSVENAANYGKLMLYLFPDKLKSFQRINPNAGRFSYPLNNLIMYDIAVVGINEDGYYIYTKNSLNSGELGTVSLRKVSEEEFSRIIESLNAGRDLKKVKVAGELDWLSKEQQNYKVQRLRQANAAFRQTVRRTVFSCESTGAEWESAPDEVEEQPGADLIGI